MGYEVPSNGLLILDVEARVAQANTLFKSGYNCAQSVVGAYADLYGFTKEQALLMSASFGGGIGRMRETCGAACGMFILARLETGTTDSKNVRGTSEDKDVQGKGYNYKVVQQLAAEFVKRNGYLRCGDLLGIPSEAPQSSSPAPRTDEYYKKRPCVQIVEEAARMFGEFLSRQVRLS